MGRKTLVSALAIAFALAMGGCASPDATPEASSAGSSEVSQESASPTAEEQAATPQPDVMDAGQASNEANEDDEEVVEMRMSIGGTDVSVEWEGNQAVADLRALAAEGPVTVGLSMYGGFEQVGPLGTSLTASDVQMTAEPGDIVLYAGNQISVFYGSNSWAYTKLGHVTDKTAEEMADLLGNVDTSITIAIR